MRCTDLLDLVLLIRAFLCTICGDFRNGPILRVSVFFLFFYHLSHSHQIWFRHIIQAIKWNHVCVCMFVIASVSCRTISTRRVLMWWGWEKRESLSSVLYILYLPNILPFKSGADFSVKKEGKKTFIKSGFGLVAIVIFITRPACFFHPFLIKSFWLFFLHTLLWCKLCFWKKKSHNERL